MATVQHSALPSSQCHEPLHISDATTADAGKVITADSSTNGVSDFRKLTPTDISSTGKTNWNGWGQWADAVYTSGSPLAINPIARTRVTIDGLGSGTITSYLPSGSSEWWDAANDKIIGDNIGDTYVARLTFKAKTNTASSYATFDLDIEGSENIILQETIVYPKGTATEHSYVLVWPVFTLTTFLANGGKIYVTPSTIDQTFYDFQIHIQKTHSEV